MDNKDYNSKKRNIEVYIIPVFTFLCLSSISYLSSKYFKLANYDLSFELFIAVSIGLIIHFWNKTDWIKLPDGTYFNFDNKRLIDNSKTNHCEYKRNRSNDNVEFKNSFFSKITLIIAGTFATIGGMYIFFESGILFTILLLSIGFFTIFKGSMELINKSPELVLNNDGLWTKKLNFQSWSRIRNIAIIKQKVRYRYSSFLVIYLNNDNKTPSQRINIDDFENKEKLETMIDRLNLNKS